MTGLAGIVTCLSRRESNVIPKLLRMMRALKHRGNDAFGVATEKELLIANNLRSLEARRLESSIAIGYNLMEILPIDIPQPCQIPGGAISLDGEIYSEESVTGVEELVRNINGTTLSDFLLNLVRSKNGAFAISAIVDGKIHLARDSLGLKPLYYGEDSEFYATASEKKALWSAGITNATFFPPGNVAVVTDGGLSIKSARTIPESKVDSATTGSVAGEIHQRLLDSVRIRTNDTTDVAIAFSGGLDSGYVAYIAKSLDRNIALISVGMKESHDLVHAQQAARKLGIPIISRVFDKEELQQAISQILWCIEDCNPMRVEVAVAIGWIACTAAKEGYKVVLTGQGSDELFAGYARFARILASKGSEAARKAMVKSVVDAHLTNYTRDEQVSNLHRIRLRHPFADWGLTYTALSLPIESNLGVGDISLRKMALRESAKLAGVPRSIVEAPKCAVQYGSGIHKALSEISRTRNLPVNQFLENVYKEISWDRPHSLQ